MKVWRILFLLLVVSLVACGGGGESDASPSDTSDGVVQVSTGDAKAGEDLYNSVCIACHGPGGVGMEGLGKPFTTSEFVGITTDEDLLTFVKSGRPISDPANTTGVDMPPKGGNPALTDEQILDIIAYLRTLR
ncbi:MAG: cytochrome c [Anaerolineales bacterium]|nr:cytochrome c [Anaerolineales bacterium]MCB8952762.1 cytochrome c [Ardenticatenales bacterium]